MANAVGLLSWLHLLASAAAAPPSCGSAAFPHPTDGAHCMGLSANPSATSAAACELQCCKAEDDTCVTWVYSNSSGCWVGDTPCVGTAGGFLGAGASRVPVNPPSPPCNGTGPLKFPINGIGCSGLTGSNAGSAEACGAACCASSTCVTWVFNPKAGIAGQHCWSGELACAGKGGSSPGWDGASKVPINAPPPTPPPLGPPPPPIPFVIPRLAPRPSLVRGVAVPLLSLHGLWDFKPSLTEPPTWSPMLVPAEYTVPGDQLQGHRVPAGTPVLYRRNFTVAAGEKTRVKLRADGCYSECLVSVNGRSVGSHLGGFTPFELDITDALLNGGDGRETSALFAPFE
jgi:hypothetical protein